MSGIYLHDIQFAVGESKPIEEIHQLSANEALLGKFRNDGLQRYRQAHKTHLDLAQLSAQKTLASAGVKPGELGAVLFCSETIHRRPAYMTEVGRFPNMIGQPNAYLYGCYLNACSNFTTALKLGGALLKSGDCDQVLLVTSDKAQSEARVMPGAIALLSDGAASCLLSKRPGGFQVNVVACRSNADLFTIEPGVNQVAFLAGMVNCVKKLFDQVLSEARVDRRDISWLVSNNYSHSIYDSFAGIGSFPSEKVNRENLADYSHCFAADVLINLKTMLESQNLEPGQRLVTLSSGQGYFGSSLLQVAKGEPSE